MIQEFIDRYSTVFSRYPNKYPWEITEMLEEIVQFLITGLNNNYEVRNGIVIHNDAVVEQNVAMKGPIIISSGCFIGANAYLRGPLFFDKGVKIGAGCEIKQSVIFSETAIAHFNYIGNSIIGSRVNFEAGAVAANHFNERKDKTISAMINGNRVVTNVSKFGALVGDDSKIGANAVLSPGTILPKQAIVGRLELVKQY